MRLDKRLDERLQLHVFGPSASRGDGVCLLLAHRLELGVQVSPRAFVPGAKNEQAGQGPAQSEGNDKGTPRQQGAQGLVVTAQRLLYCRPLAGRRLAPKHSATSRTVQRSPHTLPRAALP